MENGHIVRGEVKSHIVTEPGEELVNQISEKHMMYIMQTVYRVCLLCR